MSYEYTTNGDMINEINERMQHSDTMRRPSALEITWFNDAADMLKFMTIEEREAWLDALIGAK